MEKHLDLSDLEFEKQFSDRSIQPELFTHEAHLRLAWIHISKYGIKKALDNVSMQIQAFANFHGGGAKYNQTVTLAAIRAVYHFVLKSKSDNFPDFIQEFPRLKHNLKELLNTHYQIDIFNSERAKQEYLEPDLVPFDKILT